MVHVVLPKNTKKISKSTKKPECFSKPRHLLSITTQATETLFNKAESHNHYHQLK